MASILPRSKVWRGPPGTLRGYVEVHIEQGPVLLQHHLPVGVVTGIAGAGRFRVTIRGTAGHAGTVPMPLRHDAAAAAAEIVLAAEKRCSTAPTLVGTVGQLAVPQGAINVIPGVCEFSIDIRAGDDATRDAAIADVLEAIKQIAVRRGVTANITEVAGMPPSPARRTCKRRWRKPYHAPASRCCICQAAPGTMQRCLPASPISACCFVRCGNGGISHSPLETITAEDADLGARVLLDFLLNLDQTTS